MTTPRRMTRSFLAKMSTPSTDSAVTLNDTLKTPVAKPALNNPSVSRKIETPVMTPKTADRRSTKSISTKTSSSAIKRSKKVDEIIDEISTPAPKSANKNKLGVASQAKDNGSVSGSRRSTRKSVLKENLATPVQSKLSLERSSKKRLTDVIPVTPVENIRKRKTTGGGVENSEFGVTPIKQRKSSLKECNNSSACLTKPIDEKPVKLSISISEAKEVPREFEEEDCKSSGNKEIFSHSNDTRVNEHLTKQISEDSVENSVSVSETDELPQKFKAEYVQASGNEQILSCSNVNESIEMTANLSHEKSLIIPNPMSCMDEPGAECQLNLNNCITAEKENQSESVSLAKTESDTETDDSLKPFISETVHPDETSTEEQTENNVNNTNFSKNGEFIEKTNQIQLQKALIDRREDIDLSSSGIETNAITDDQNTACINFQPTPVKPTVPEVILIEDTPVPTKSKESIIEIIDTPISPKVTQRRKIQKTNEDLSITDHSLFERSILKRRTRRSLSTSALDTTTRANRKVKFSEFNVTISLHDIDMRLKEQYNGNSERDLRASRRKRSMSTTDVENYKQFKSKKMPNFSAIHSKQFQEMESIVEYKRRVQEKAEEAKASSEKKKIPGSNTKSRDANPKSAIQIKFNYNTKEDAVNEPSTVIKTDTIKNPINNSVIQEAENNDTEKSTKSLVEIQNSIANSHDWQTKVAAEDNKQIQLNTSFTCESPSLHAMLPVAEQTLKDEHEFISNETIDVQEKRSSDNKSENDQTCTVTVDKKPATSSFDLKADFSKSVKKPKTVFGFADTKKPVNFNATSAVPNNQSKITSTGLNSTSKGLKIQKSNTGSEMRHKTLYKAGRTCQSAPKVEMKGVRLNKRFHLMMQYRKNLDKET